LRRCTKTRNILGMDKSAQHSTQTNPQKGGDNYGLHTGTIPKRKRNIAQARMAFGETHDQIFGNAHRTDGNENG
jgi:hypothetical protein